MNIMKHILLCVIGCVFFSIPALAEQHIIASLDDDDTYLDEIGQPVADPIEGFNRVVFVVNDSLLEYVARPLYTGYSYVTPRFLRTGIKNIFHNLLFPVRFVNNLLQGRGQAAGVEMSRFVMNTVYGVGGFFDVAARHKPVVPVYDEDLGQTFGVWGAGEGFYLVLPLFGPSSLRDGTGMVGDFFLDPITYVSPRSLSLGLSAGRAFNRLDDVLDSYDDIKRTAIEPYSSFRSAYIQYRRAQIIK